MTDPTPLDSAHAAMAAAPEDDAARLTFYERLADCELFLLLEEEAEGETISPRIFSLAEGEFALAFDRETRLADFAKGPAAYAALSGRVLISMLEGQDIGLAVNFDVAPSSTMVPASALSWLQDTLGHEPDAIEARPVELRPPSDIPESLLMGLDTKLSSATGLARCVYLVKVVYDTGAEGDMLAFIDARAGAEGALANAVNEALTFSGVEGAVLDVAFFGRNDAIAVQLAKTGLRFDLPKAPKSVEPKPPGRDPKVPPKLK